MDIEEFIKTYHPGLSEYCAAIITQNGKIYGCESSHLELLKVLYGDLHIMEKIPADTSPLFWLTIQLHCVLVDYENQIFSDDLTREESYSLMRLEQVGLICRNEQDIHGYCRAAL